MLGRKGRRSRLARENDRIRRKEKSGRKKISDEERENAIANQQRKKHTDKLDQVQKAMEKNKVLRNKHVDRPWFFSDSDKNLAKALRVRHFFSNFIDEFN